MTTEWKKVKLGDICSKIGSGATPSGGSRVYIEKGISFIRSQNVYNLNFDYEGLTHITDEAAKKLNGVTIEKDDVLLNITGDSVARTCIVPENVLPARVNQHVSIIRPKEKTILPMFLNYYLSSPYMQSVMLGLAVGKGASRNAITKTMIENFEVPCPPLETQQKIAGILSAYDDLIENNRKQIKLLEEAAQKLYKEWFVKLNFPDHENVKIVDGVPEGWKKEKLINLIDVQYGYAFDGSKFNSEGNGKPIIRIRNIPQGTTDDFTTEQTIDDYIVHNGDIVVGMDGEFHINTWNQNDAYLVQRACSFRPHNENMKGYILQAIYAPIKFFENTVVGATVAHLGKKHIDTIEIWTCNEELYIPFQNMFRKRQTLLNQIQLLKSARDKLLPRLMNGELKIDSETSSE